jgi:hypothetical protein
MADVGYEPWQQEMVRRVLADTTTCIGATRIVLQCGAPQGSPVSPTLAVIFFESLARAIRGYISEHPEGVPPTLQRINSDIELVLSVLLLYADDTTLVGSSRAWMQGLLDCITAWAEEYRIKFNAGKSVSITLHRGGESIADITAVPLRVQGADIPEVSEGTMLGIPVRASLRRSADALVTFTPAATAVSIGMARIAALFTVRPGRSPDGNQVEIDFPLLTLAIRQIILPKALYAAPVVDLDTEALDRRLRRELRGLLGLPATFPSGLLYWVLRLWPSQLVGDYARLQFAWRCRHQFWMKDVLQPLINADRRTLPPELTSGYWRLITQTLERHGLSWRDLDAQQFAYKPGAPRTQPGYRAWRKRCRSLIIAAYAKWAVQQRREASVAHQPLFPTSEAAALEMIKAGLPKFLTECGDLGRAGLRMLADSLRSGGANKPCALCGRANGETPAHALRCPHREDDLRFMRTAAYQQRGADIQSQLDGTRVAPRYVAKNMPAWDVTMDWPGMTRSSLALYLWSIGCTIDFYCKEAKRRGDPHPPRRVQLHASLFHECVSATLDTPGPSSQS